MMKIFIKIILFLLFSNCALANCDFEIVKMKSGIHSLASKINLIHNIENIQIACHNFLKQGFKTKFDVVVSNPPYISKNNMDSLQAEVRNFDPQLAITDDADGLTFFKRFSEQFENMLNSTGYLLLEFGGNKQKKRVEQIFTDAGFKTEFFKDLQNDWRIVEVQR